MKNILFVGIMLALLSFAFISTINRTITGIIKDDNGNAVAFATIKAKGTNIATRSDANGKFTISVSDKVKALEISYIGYNNNNKAY